MERADRWLETRSTCQSLSRARNGLAYYMPDCAAASSPLSFMYIGDCLKGTQLLMDNDVRDPIRLGARDW